MTTWCRPDRASFALNRRGSSSTGTAAAAAAAPVAPISPSGGSSNNKAGTNKRSHHHRQQQHHVRYGSELPFTLADQTAPLSSRHSIADILGWKNPSSAATAVDGNICKIEQGEQHNNNNNNNNNQFQQLVLGRRYDDTEGEEEEEEPEEEEEEEAEVMASDCVDVADLTVNISDEPLDLSLDKSKCRQREREREVSGATPIKRAKGMMAVDAMGEPASDGGTDEGDLDGVGQWGNVQPHLQMAANFSTVLQYYLTAARLWQTSEVIRCQESQARAGGETDSEANDDGHGSDTNTAAAAVVAAAVAAAAGNESAGVMLPVQQVQQPSNNNNNNNSSGSSNKRRKNKDGQHQNHMVMVSDLVNSGAADSGGNGQSRPRKTRTTFTGKQLFELERIFEQKKYLSSNERQEVARLLNVTGSQIKIWFQNRRTKWKKQDPNTAAELAQLKSASRSSQGGGSSSSAAVPKGKNGEDLHQSGSTNANDDVASAGDNEEINSDDASSPPAPRSPSPV